MADNTSKVEDITCETFPPFRRNNYFYGKLLSVKDFKMEQQYFINKNRLSNLFIHGSGVVCRLHVSKSSSHELKISSGDNLDSSGHEIIVSERHFVDLNKTSKSGESS